MARLSAFKVNSAAIEAGEWVSPGEEYDDLMIKTRGYGDAYYDAQAQKMRRAALAHNGDVAKVSNAKTREIRVECLITHLLLDVRGLADDDGNTVDFARFCEMLREPDYGPLVVACQTAAALVGRQAAQDKADAAKN